MHSCPNSFFLSQGPKIEELDDDDLDDLPDLVGEESAVQVVVNLMKFSSNSNPDLALIYHRQVEVEPVDPDVIPG